MHCKYCGTQIPDDSVFCTFCGHQLVYSLPDKEICDEANNTMDTSHNLFNFTPVPSSVPDSETDATLDSPKKSHGKNGWVLAATAVLVALLVFVGLWGIPAARNGKEAISQIETGNYLEAITLYTEMSPLSQKIYQEKLVVELAKLTAKELGQINFISTPKKYLSACESYRSAAAKLSAHEVKSTNLQGYLNTCINTLRPYADDLHILACFIGCMEPFTNGLNALYTAATLSGYYYQSPYLNEAYLNFTSVKQKINDSWTSDTVYDNTQSFTRLNNLVDSLIECTQLKTSISSNISYVLYSVDDDLQWYLDITEEKLNILKSVDFSSLALENLYY